MPFKRRLNFNLTGKLFTTFFLAALVGFIFCSQSLVRATQLTPIKPTSLQASLNAPPQLPTQTPDFMTIPNYPISAPGYTLVAADFNGDSKLDVVTGGTDTSNTLGIELGNGDGSFQTPQNIAVSSSPHNIYSGNIKAGDFNKDSKLDLLVVIYKPNSTSTSGVKFLPGNGDGTFQVPLTIDLGFIPGSILTSDLNGDGNLDLLAIKKEFYYNNSFISIETFLGAGDGTFQPSTSYNFTGVVSPAIGDVNNDGKPDLAFFSDYNIVSVMFGNGDGTFQSAGTYTTAAPGYTYGQFIEIEDLNQDNKPDLILGPTGPYPLNILLNNGNGTFAAPIHYGTSDQNYASIVVLDLNGDSKLDVVAKTSFRTVTVLEIILGNGDGTFQVVGQYNPGYDSYSMAGGDFNGDGKNDLVISLGSLTFLEGNGDGTIQAYRSFLDGLTPAHGTLGDFNEDGKLDQVEVNNNGNNLGLLTGKGDGTFQDTVFFNVGTNPNWVATGDFNKDNHLDVVTANSGSNNISVLLGNGNGTFQPAVYYSTGKFPKYVAVADINLDGNMDLITMNSIDHNLSIFSANGNGTFKPAANFPVANTLCSLAIADFTEDSKPDLALGLCGSTNTINILRGNGNGTFDPWTSISLSGAPVKIQAYDLNNDGLTDLVSFTSGSIQNGDVITSLLQNQDGSFRSTRVALQSNGSSLTYSLTLRDLNRDGLVDVIAGKAGYVFLADGNGDGTFQAGNYFPISTDGVTSITPGDLNGDKALDIVITNLGQSDVTPVKGYTTVLLNLKVDNCVLTVVTTGDDTMNCGSLRRAIQYANEQDGSQPVTISFSGIDTVNLTTSLPPLNRSSGGAIIIDGGCQVQDTRSIPGIKLHPASAGLEVEIGLQIANNVSLQGLAITGFKTYGLEISGSGSSITCNWIGTNDGLTAAPNGYGIHLTATATNNTLGLENRPTRGNLIGGNTGAGVIAGPGNSLNLYYNWFGYQKDGHSSLKNGSNFQLAPGAHLVFNPGNKLKNGV